MSRMRSRSFPKLNTSNHYHDENGNSPTMGSSPYLFSSAHSRDSSAASSQSSPVTPTFSTRGHSRWPSSGSSLTIPDSPATAPTSKTTLHDLVEDPAERDDIDYGFLLGASDEPLCICDHPVCEHRQAPSSQDTAAPLATPEWTPGDDYFSDGQLPGEPFPKRRRSGVTSTDSLTSRLSRHFPSISKRFQGHKSAASVTGAYLRSAPSSRSSSLRLPSTRSFTAPSMPEIRTTAVSSPVSPATPSEGRSVSPPRKRAISQATSMPIEIDTSRAQEDPTDGQQHASTPLLPPMMAQYFSDSAEELQSPLQSPTVANSAAASIANTPAGTPVLPGFPTPPLSAKASFASLRHTRSGQMPLSIPDIPPLTIAEESEDPWANKLGHANFNITPEPYIPEVCDAQSCKRLADDWEAARVEYMRQAVRIREHYGITSQTYKLTEQKWAEIDAAWRANHELVNTEAQASGERPFFQPLAETQPLAKMPSLNDPQQPLKFPTIDEKDIVGPMVRYAKIQHEHKPTKKASFLKLFTDPAFLLGGRSNMNVRR